MQPRIGDGLDEAGLSVVLAVGDFTCALEATRVLRLEPKERVAAGPDAKRPQVPLAELLGVEGGEAGIAVVLNGRPEILLADRVEAVRDLREARFLALPTLTHLVRPAFRGLHQMAGDVLLPVLDVDGLLGGGDDGG